MKAVLYYYEASSMNDATSYYIDVIRKGLSKVGYNFEYTQNLNCVVDSDIIVTITVMSFLRSKLRNRNAQTIFWSQGVGPEEAIMGGKTLNNLFRYVCRYYLTLYALHRAAIVFVVSDAMRQYYKKKYWYKKDNCVVMPCYNQPLSNYFDLEQYKKPTFVYAGNASVWQGVDLMLDIYKQIEDVLPNAKITLLSKNKKEFENKIKERNIKNYEIKYVEVKKLAEELHNYKYGFIIRDKSIVNEVATPTKMNSDLASYLIPIYSDTVDDFKRNINLQHYKLMATYPLSADVICKQIVDFEKEIKDYDEYKEIVEKVFSNHYNDNVYIDMFVNILGDKILKK